MKFEKDVYFVWEFATVDHFYCLFDLSSIPLTIRLSSDGIYFVTKKKCSFMHFSTERSRQKKVYLNMAKVIAVLAENENNLNMIIPPNRESSR